MTFTLEGWLLQVDTEVEKKQLKGTGLSLVDDLYIDRAGGVREPRKRGQRVMGYFGSLVPVEMFTALGLIPYRIIGNAAKPATESLQYLETNACSFVHSSLDLVLRGEYDFLDGIVIPHSCDHFTKAYTIFKYHLNLPYSHFLNVPHLADESSREFFMSELMVFKRSLEEYAGQELSETKLTEAISLHNTNRGLARQLNELRKEAPPLISGSEAIKVASVSAMMPISESNRMLEAVIDEVKNRPHSDTSGRKRLMIYSSVLDQVPLVELIEQVGADVVSEILYSGSVDYLTDVPVTSDPFEGLIEHYLELPTGRTYNRPRTGSHKDDVINRFTFLYERTRELNAHGIILYAIRHCEVFGFDLPDVRDFLREKGIPVLVIEDEYVISAPERLRTRIEAFLGTIRG